MALQVLSAQSW